MVKFTELFEDCTSHGVKVPTEEYKDIGKYLIVDQGQTDIAGYTDREDGVYTDVPAIIFGDHTRVVKYVDKPFFLGADGTKLLKCKIFNANYRYLYYALRNARIPNTGYNRHFKWLKEIEIEYPDANRQTEVAEILDRVEKLIEERKNELEQLDILIKARFVEMFRDMADPSCKWNSCSLIDACEDKDDIKCGPFGTQLSKDEYQSEGIPVWEIPQINSNFGIQPEHFLTEAKAQQLSAYSLKAGDIVMSRKGNVGKCAVFQSYLTEGILHSDVLRIRVSKEKADPVFMTCQLHYSRDVLRQIEMVSSGAIMAGVNVTKLKTIMIKIPPVELQNEFSEFVAQVDKSKAAVQKALEETQLLFDKLMQDYFG